MTSFSLRRLLILALCPFLTSCTRVVFKQAVGAPLKDASAAEYLIGDWIGDKGSVWHVEKTEDADFLNVKWTENDKPRTSRILLRMLPDDIFVVWAEDPELKSYTPLRVVGADDAVALLYPDSDVVKRLVGEGRLSGTFDKDKNLWTISPGDWEAVLAGKDFWELRSGFPFVKVSKSAAKSVAALAVALPGTDSPAK